MSRKRKFLFVLAVLLAVVCFIGLYIWVQADRRQERERLALLQDEDHVYTVNFGGTWYRLRRNLDTYLLIGIDKDSDRLENLDPEAKLNNLQSDFLMLVAVDRDSGTVTALQINRDTMAEIPRIGKAGERIAPVTQQLALAHTYGSGGRDSCVNTVHAVSGLLYDLLIDHYVSVTMDAVPVLTDLAGGVPVYVEDDFHLDALKQGETVTLHGDLALTFVRSRMSVADGSNLNRMNRQRVYLNSLYDRLREKMQEDGFALRLAKELSEYTVSDMLTEELAKAAEQVDSCRFTGIEVLPGEAVKGEVYIEFYPDEPALQELLIQLLFEPVPAAAS